LSERRAHSSAEGLDTVAAGKAIGTVQESLAAALAHPGVVSRPIVDARPARLALVWDKEHENPLVDIVLDIARDMRD
jgi:DNA-binding transcriptional LysR family regulator